MFNLLWLSRFSLSSFFVRWIKYVTSRGRDDVPVRARTSALRDKYWGYIYLERGPELLAESIIWIGNLTELIGHQF